MKLALSLLLSLSYSTSLSPTLVAQSQSSFQPIQFVDMTASAGITWNLRALAPGTKYLIETMGGGGGFIDYNGDALLDIYLVCYSETPQPAGASALKDILYKNNGDGTFTEVTRNAGISNSMLGMGLAVGDYNNDGWPDMFVTGYRASKLFRNNGNGTFTDVTAKAAIGNNLWGTSAAFLDLCHRTGAPSTDCGQDARAPGRLVR